MQIFEDSLNLGFLRDQSEAIVGCMTARGEAQRL